MSNQLYFNQFMGVIKMHEIETVDTRTIINEMMAKFYYYIVAEELAEIPYSAQHVVTKANNYVFFQ